MALGPNEALELLKELDFHTYHAKSWNESLLVHSFSVYSVVNGVLPFTQIYSQREKELMRWAALLHDFGKTSENWQRTKKGPHKVSRRDTSHEAVKSALSRGIARYSSHILRDQDIDEILFIITYHHGSGRTASTSARNRMKDVVSECDRAVSQTRVSDALIQSLNTIIDTVRFRLFVVELIEHPISPIVIGAFDYVLSGTGHVTPILYSSTSTLYVGETAKPLPALHDVNVFLNEQLEGRSRVLRLDGSNARIYTSAAGFLQLASQPDLFLAEAARQANGYCEAKRRKAERDPEAWSDELEQNYLYGRVCGATYNALLDLCHVGEGEQTTLQNGNPFKLRRLLLEPGGRAGAVTVRDLEFCGLKKKGRTYQQTLKEILDLFHRFLASTDPKEQTASSFSYDVGELLAPDSSVYASSGSLDPKRDALADYTRYMVGSPLDVCPTCNHFRQGSVSAAAFPTASPLGGTVEVFYTRYMRLVKKEGGDKRGVSFCAWCNKWWDLISVDADGDRQLYHLCVMPHHLFARLDWREILKPDPTMPLVELGDPATLGSGVYPHIAMLSLRGRDHNALVAELVGDPQRSDDQILDRLHSYGLRGAVIVTNPASSRYLLTSGSLKIDSADWSLLRSPLRLLNSGRCSYHRAIRAFQESEYAFGTLLSNGSIRVTNANRGEVINMIAELAAKTGLSFLADVWIGSQRGERLDNASKVIRGMNETLRRLKDREDQESLIDSMIAKGLHLALSTRDGQFRSVENQRREEAALRATAEKLLKYKDQTYRRTELVRAMIYTLAYFSKSDSKAPREDDLPKEAQ